MTKQKEIREGIHKTISDSVLNQVTLDGLNYSLVHFERMENALLSYLHSQGVVIKVNGIFDDDSGETTCVGICNITCHNSERYLMLKAGYVAVEPLIKGI